MIDTIDGRIRPIVRGSQRVIVVADARGDIQMLKQQRVLDGENTDIRLMAEGRIIPIVAADPGSVEYGVENFVGRLGF